MGSSDSQAPNHKQQLKFALSGLCTRDLEQTSVAAARAVLREIRPNKLQLTSALKDILAGVDAAPKHAARARLQLAEYAVLECVSHPQLVQLLPSISQQALVILAAHRKDAACINSLAALLSSCFAKLLHGPQQGSYAGMYSRAAGLSSPELITADYLCESMLFPAIKSTFRDPEQTRISAGSVVLLGLFEVLKAHTDQAEVVEAVRRCLSLMLQLMASGTVAQRAPGVFLPVCSCVEVLGLSMDKEGTRRLLKQACKAAMVHNTWQVRRDACQALAVLAASLQFRTLPAGHSATSGQPELVQTPAVELLIAHKPIVLQVLDDVRYDKIAAVRTAAASAWAEFKTLPDPSAAAAVDASPSSRPDRAGAASSKLSSKTVSRGSQPGRRGKRSGTSAHATSRQRPPPPRFVRPKVLPDAERDFGVLVFAPRLPPPPPAPPVSTAPEPAEAADISHAHNGDQHPVARQLLFDDTTSVHASMDAASQTCAEAAVPATQPYTVQSPLAVSSNPLFAASSSLSPGHSVEQAELQRQLQQQLQQPQQPGLQALLAATGFSTSSPVRIDVSHHVHGRVELGITYSADSSPAAAGGAPAAADMVAAAVTSAASPAGSQGPQHTVQTICPVPTVQQQDVLQQEQQQQGAEQPAWPPLSADGSTMAYAEPSFGPAVPDATATDAVPSAPPATQFPAYSLELPDGLGAAAAAAAAAFTSGPQHTLPPLRIASPAGLMQQQGDPADEEDHLQPVTAAVDPAAAHDAASPGSTGEGRRQRQRWQLPSLSAHEEDQGPNGSVDTADATDNMAGVPASMHGDPSLMSPRSPSSLDVLRSVGQRVQHLLETLSRQTSGSSSRHGGRSPILAAQQPHAIQGPPTMAGAPPPPRTATVSSSAGSSSVASTQAANSTAAVSELAVFADVDEPLNFVTQQQAEQPAQGQHDQDGTAEWLQAHSQEHQQQAWSRKDQVALQQRSWDGSPAELQWQHVQLDRTVDAGGSQECQPQQLGTAEQQQDPQSHSTGSQPGLLQDLQGCSTQPTQSEAAAPQHQAQQPEAEAKLQAELRNAPPKLSHALPTALLQQPSPHHTAELGDGVVPAAEDVLDMEGQQPHAKHEVQQGLQSPLLDPATAHAADYHQQQQSCPDQQQLAAVVQAGEHQTSSTAVPLQQQEPEQQPVAPQQCLAAATAVPGTHAQLLREKAPGGPGSSAAAAPAPQQPVQLDAVNDADAQDLVQALPVQAQPADPLNQQFLQGMQDAQVQRAQQAAHSAGLLDAGVETPDCMQPEQQQTVGQAAPLEQQEGLQQQDLAAVQELPGQTWLQAQQERSQLQRGSVPEERVSEPAAVDQETSPANTGAAGLPQTHAPDDMHAQQWVQHQTATAIQQQASELEDNTLLNGSESGTLTPQSTLYLHEPTGGPAGPAAVNTAPLRGPPAAVGLQDEVKLLYNDLYQPSAGEAQHSDAAAGPATSTAGSDGAAALPVVGSSGVMLDSTGATAAAEPDGVTGLSRVDKALEKLQSLRSTLRHISSTGGGGGGGVGSLSARASLSSTRTASLQLLTAETSHTALNASRSAEVLQAKEEGRRSGSSSSTAEAIAGPTSTTGAGATAATGTEGVSALASAKDWIREISERLQQVGPAEVQADHGAVPLSDGAAAAVLSNAPMLAASGSSETGLLAPAAHSSGFEASENAAPVFAASSGGSAAGPAASPGLHDSMLDEAAALTAQQTAARADAASGAELSQDGNMPHEPVQIGAVTGAANVQLQHTVPGSSAGWSTLTAGTSSSSSSMGSEQFINLVEEQLHNHSNPPAGPGAGTEADVEGAGAVSSSGGGSMRLSHTVSTPVDGSATWMLQSPPPHVEAPQLPLQQQQLQAHSDAGALAQAGPLTAAGVDEATLILAESHQRLQGMLSQADDTMLLMSFALKLDRLGRTFRPTGEEVSAAGAAAAAILPAPLATPHQSCANSPSSAASPLGPWTSITHNSLYNASPASSPQKQAVSSVLHEAKEGLPYECAVVPHAAGPRLESRSSEAADTAGLEPAADLCGPPGDMSCCEQQEEQQQQGVAGEALFQPCWELHDAVLRNTLGIGLQQLQESGAEVVTAVAAALSCIQQQLQEGAGIAPISPNPAADTLQPQLIVLMQGLRQELRQQCRFLLLSSTHAHNDAPAFEDLFEQEERWFMNNCLPCLLQLVQSAAAV